MSIYRTSYDTSACSGFIVKNIEDQLDVGLRSGAFATRYIKLEDHGEEFKIHLLQGGIPAADIIPSFKHPMLIKGFDLDEHHKPKMEFVIDVRPFGYWYAPNEKYIVRKRPEFMWDIKRMLLNQVWLTQRPEILRDVSFIPASVYASLISEATAKRFALDNAEQITISVLACYFYYGLFTDDLEFDEVETNKVAGMIARATNVPADKVFSIIDGLKVMDSLEELCEACKEKTGSVALTGFNIGVLIAITAGNWFGTNSRENLAVALEHPPTWIMIVAASLDESTYKRSVIAKISERYDKKGAAANFIKTMDILLGGRNFVAEKIILED